MSEARHYIPQVCEDGGWTIRATGGGEPDHVCTLSCYTSMRGEEGRLWAQAAADRNNALARGQA